MAGACWGAQRRGGEVEGEEEGVWKVYWVERHGGDGGGEGGKGGVGAEEEGWGEEGGGDGVLGEEGILMWGMLRWGAWGFVRCLGGLSGFGMVVMGSAVLIFWRKAELYGLCIHREPDYVKSSFSSLV